MEESSLRLLGRVVLHLTDGIVRCRSRENSNLNVGGISLDIARGDVFWVDETEVASLHPLNSFRLRCDTRRCYAMFCDATRRFAMLCRAMRCYAMLCDAMLCDAMRCCAMRCCAMRCYAMMRCACDAMRCACDAMLCDAMRC